MKKKTLIITIIFCVLFSVIIGLILSLSHKNEKMVNYDEPDADLTCSYEGISIDDSGSEIGSYYNYMYIYKDKNEYVTKVIYKSVYNNTYFGGSIEELTQSVLDLYSDIDGITTSIDTNKNTSVVTITYDYSKIDLKTAKKELKSLLDEESVFMNMKSNITVEEYLDLEDPDYTCK